MASSIQITYSDKIPLAVGETTSADPLKKWLSFDANMVKAVVNQKADDTLATVSASGLVPAKSGTATHVLIAGSGANPEWAAVPVPAGVLLTANRLSEIATAGGSAQAQARTNLGLNTLATLSTVGTAQIDNGAVTLAKVQNISTSRILGRISASTGVVEELNAAQVKTMLAIVPADISGFNSAVQSLVSAPNPSTIDHNLLLNYVANRHIDHSAVTITGTNGLTGGGDLTASRTISLNIDGLPVYSVLDSPLPGTLDEIVVQSATNDLLYKVTKGNFLADYENSESVYVVSSAQSGAIAVTTGNAKTVRRFINIPSALVTGGTLNYTITITSLNGTSGSIFVNNQGGSTVNINVPSGYQVPSGITVPTPVAAGKTREFFFVNNGTSIVWSVNEELVTVV